MFLSKLIALERYLNKYQYGQFEAFSSSSRSSAFPTARARSPSCIMLTNMASHPRRFIASLVITTVFLLMFVYKMDWLDDDGSKRNSLLVGLCHSCIFHHSRPSAPLFTFLLMYPQKLGARKRYVIWIRTGCADGKKDGRETTNDLFLLPQ